MRFEEAAFDVAIVGGGIVGLAHAWQAARRGYSVGLFERDAAAQGASIRNFGMIWVMGQPPELLATAMRSRQLWLEAGRDAGLWVRECGAMHLAYREDERAVLEEFAGLAPALGYRCRMIDAKETLRRSTVACPDGLLGALLSETELNVDPREAIGRLPRWLSERFGIALHFGTVITRIEAPNLVASDGGAWRARRIIVCGGADVQTLYPTEIAAVPYRRCKLQMLATEPQPAGWSLGPMLAGGLTLQHYANFQACPSLPALKARIERQTPEVNQFGIHVMFSQNSAGEVVIGDSHEYDDEIPPFDRAEIETLILRHAAALAVLPKQSISRRWHGTYLKLAGGRNGPLALTPEPGVYVLVAAGGTGMTMSFGIADKLWDEWPDLPLDAAAAPGQSRSPAATV
jgi:FAD dependent oxidoreductase TIGR03364